MSAALWLQLGGDAGVLAAWSLANAVWARSIGRRERQLGGLMVRQAAERRGYPDWELPL